MEEARHGKGRLWCTRPIYETLSFPVFAFFVTPICTSSNFLASSVSSFLFFPVHEGGLKAITSIVPSVISSQLPKEMFRLSQGGKIKIRDSLIKMGGSYDVTTEDGQAMPKALISPSAYRRKILLVCVLVYSSLTS